MTDERITFLGHATVLVEMNGLRILTDPVFRQVVLPLWRRSPCPSADTLAGVDMVLLSHLHLDHFDPPSLRQLGFDTPIVAPTGSQRLLRRRGFSDIRELAPGEQLRVGGLTVTATHAKHPAGRHPLIQGPPSVGYVLSGDREVYFAGDTGLFSEMADLWPQLDVALLPIAGLGPRLPEVKHMSPRHAVQAMRLLKPRITIPIHWGTYHLPGTTLMRMGPDVHRAAPQVFMRAAAALEPDIRTVLLQPGQAFHFEQHSAPVLAPAAVCAMPGCV